jgi:hypothetical protein
MSADSKRKSPLKVATWAALVGFLVTGLLPVLFFRFPGPELMPLSYESMWAITEVLWKPLRILQAWLNLWQLNPYFIAAFVNTPLAFFGTYAFLRLGARWRNRSRDASVAANLHPVLERIEEIRADYLAAWHDVPHPAAHNEAVMQDAKKKVAERAYFQKKAEAEASPEEDNDD